MGFILHQNGGEGTLWEPGKLCFSTAKEDVSQVQHSSTRNTQFSQRPW